VSNLTGTLVAVAVGLSFAGAVSGTPFRYEVTSVATGTLGATSFTDAAVTVTTLADTLDVTISGSAPFTFWQVVGPTTISVSGIGTATFSVNDYGAVSGSFFGFGLIADLTETQAVLGIVGNPNLAGFNLQSPIGPVTGAAIFNQETFLTSMGNLNITGTGSLATFQAAAVPEPAQGMAFTGVLLLGAALYRRTRR
jgi:hypothetical protein